MYPTIVADFLAEVHLYLALFICGALGYLLMKRTKDVCPQRMAPPQKEKLFPDADEAEEEKVEEKENEEEEAEVQEETQVEQSGPEPHASAVGEDVATPEAEAVAAPPKVSEQVSERTARILAKKAARKARKAQEQAQAQAAPVEEEEEEAEEEGCGPPAEEEVQKAAPVEEALPEEEEIAPEEVAAPLEEDEAAAPVAEEEELAAPAEEATSLAEEEVEAAAPTEEVVEKMDSPLSQLKSVEWYTIEEPDHGLNCAEPDLSTTWERSSREESVEDTGSSHGAGFEDEEGYGGRQSSWYEYQQPCHSWKEPVQQRRTAPLAANVDPWELPLDEMIRSPVEAEQVYAQMYEERMVAEQAQQSVQYQPVLCDNQQLYTDGQQFYMLACITGAEDEGESALREVHAVTDAHDPLHAEFAANANPAGYVDISMLGDQPQPVEEDAAAWDICWSMTQ